MANLWRLAAAFLCLWGGLAEAQAPSAKSSLVGEIAAAQPGDTIIVEFHADWCQPCKWLEDHILAKQLVKEALIGVRWFRVDGESGPGKLQAKLRTVSAYPTFLVLDSEGLELDRVEGIEDLKSVGLFLAFVDSARRITRSEAQVTGAASGGAHELLSGARWFAARDRVSEATDYYRRAIAADANNQVGVAELAGTESRTLAQRGENRRAAVTAAVDQVRRYPGAAVSNQSLALAVLSGDLKAEEASELVALHTMSARVSAPVVFAGWVAVAANMWPAAHAVLPKCYGVATSDSLTECARLAAAVKAQTPATASTSLLIQVRLALANVEYPGPEGDALRLTLMRQKRMLSLDQSANQAALDGTDKDPGKGDDHKGVDGKKDIGSSNADNGDDSPVSMTAMMQARRAEKDSESGGMLPRSALVFARVDDAQVDRKTLGARMLLALRNVRGVQPVSLLHVEVGRDAEDNLVQDGNLLLGFTATNNRMSAGLLVGGYFGDTGARSDYRAGMSVEFLLRHAGLRYGYEAWVRSTWLPNSERRNDGSERSPDGGDELSLGLALRVPVSTKIGLVGLRYDEYLGRDSTGIWLGAELW